jgi:uncharacterized phiE125 gp8 family phage protein
MPLQLVAGPAVEPLTLAELKAHLRIDTGNEEPAPGALTATLAGLGAGSVDTGAHRYAVTFVTPDGETQAGTVSSAVTVADNTANGKVALSAIPLGGSAVTARKLYRTAAAGSTYLLLATIADNTTTTYTDNIADASLGAGAPSTNTTGDPVLNRLITSVRQAAEAATRRALVTQQWKLLADYFPGGGRLFPTSWFWQEASNRGGFYSAVLGLPHNDAIELPFPPLQTVESVKYYDTAGVQQTLVADTDYTVDAASEPARIVPVYGTCWPQAQPRINAIEVAFTCGYGLAGAVPAQIKSWMLMRAGAMYENREEVVVATRLTSVELEFVDALLDPYRLFRY